MATSNLTKKNSPSELKSRLLFLFLAIIVYRAGTFIPIPGINLDEIKELIKSGQSGGFIALGSLFSGGAISRMSIFSLGLMPYISASIVIQLLSHMPGKLKELRTSGSAGKKKITQYTRYLAFAVALFQGIALCLAFKNISLYGGPAFWLVGGFCFSVGAIFLMWLGEQITERGIGNGVSMLIFAGICASLPNVLGGLFSNARSGEISSGLFISILALLIGLFFFIVFVERTQREIPIHYARQQMGQGRAANNTLPLKINLAGVIPAIFASAIILLLNSVFSFLSNNASISNLLGDAFGRYISQVSTALSSGQPLYMMLYGVLVIGFAFFYTGLVFENKELSEDLKRSGAFIQGVRPGKATADYIDLVQNRLTLVGAIYVALVILVPEVFNMNKSNNVLLVFGGTSLLIIVVVAMDFINQVQSHKISKQYQSLVKKSHLGRRKRK